MEFRLDSHTHTLASGHAYCTLLEMVRAAADRGLELICITDHAPGMELTTHKDYFLNFRVIDREIYGVRVMMGAELNVMDFDGTVGLSPKLLNNLDMAIASQHIWCMPQGGGPEENTAAMVRAMDNCPKICILGHPDDGRYPLDYPALVRAAGERGVLLEVNNTSLSPACSRVNSTANVTEMLKHCRRGGRTGGGGQRCPLCLRRGRPSICPGPAGRAGLSRGAGAQPGARRLPGPPGAPAEPHIKKRIPPGGILFSSYWNRGRLPAGRLIRFGGPPRVDAITAPLFPAGRSHSSGTRAHLNSLSSALTPLLSRLPLRQRQSGHRQRRAPRREGVIRLTQHQARR